MKASEVLAKKKKEVDEILTKKSSEFSFILEEIPTRIFRRTVLGKGVNESKELYKLQDLSDAYIKQRQKIKLSETTKPKKSNLTQSGAMLNSIIGEQKGTLFTFTLKGVDKKGISNNDKAYWNAIKGRRFFDLSSSETAGLTRIIQAKIKEILRSMFR